MRIVGCFLEYDGRLLVLHRPAHKSHGGTWGMPGGKIEPGETDTAAIIREIYEETGHTADAGELQLLGVFPCTPPSGATHDWVVYALHLVRPHDITLRDSEHDAFRWVTARECAAIPNLIYGVRDVLIATGYASAAA